MLSFSVNFIIWESGFFVIIDITYILCMFLLIAYFGCGILKFFILFAYYYLYIDMLFCFISSIGIEAGNIFWFVRLWFGAFRDKSVSGHSVTLQETVAVSSTEINGSTAFEVSGMTDIYVLGSVTIKIILYLMDSSFLAFWLLFMFMKLGRYDVDFLIFNLTTSQIHSFYIWKTSVIFRYWYIFFEIGINVCLKDLCKVDLDFAVSSWLLIVTGLYMILFTQGLLWIVSHWHYLGHCFLGQSLFWLAFIWCHQYDYAYTFWGPEIS